MESFKEPFHRHLALQYIALHLRSYKYYDYTFSVRIKYFHFLRCRQDFWIYYILCMRVIPITRKERYHFDIVKMVEWSVVRAKSNY